MSEPGRVERLWLAIAVTLLWLVVIGALVEGLPEVTTVGRLPAGGAAGPATRVRRLFELGRAELLAVRINGRSLPQGKLPKEEWPEPWHDLPDMNEEQFCSEQTYP